MQEQYYNNIKEILINNEINKSVKEYSKNKSELETYYNAIGKRESGNNYKSVNSVGYIGKYQMGEAAMIDAGYYKKSFG